MFGTETPHEEIQKKDWFDVLVEESLSSANDDDDYWNSLPDEPLIPENWILTQLPRVAKRVGTL